MSFTFHAITFGEVDYAVLALYDYGIELAILEYMGAITKDEERADECTTCEDELQQKWEDDFQVIAYDKYSFSTENDRNTGVSALVNVLNKGVVDDEASRHRRTFVFLWVPDVVDLKLL